MAGSDGGEKTEQPTGKKLKDARNRGHVPRSKETGTLFVLLAGVLGLFALSSLFADGLRDMMFLSCSLSREQIFHEDQMLRVFIQCVLALMPPIAGLAIIIMVFGLFGNTFLGGVNFTSRALGFKTSKFNPVNGIKRIFSLNSLMELVKGIAKVLCIGFFCYFAISWGAPLLMSLSYMDTMTAIKQGFWLLFWMALLIVCAMIPIVLIDAPFQKWNYIRQLRMTKQEIKDEYKETEGNPQVKRKIRRMQYSMAARRMMQKVPKADVVVTNPDHYAVALSYNPLGLKAPVVVAKGVDEIAEIIKDIARRCNVPIVPAPPLARSLFYTTELDHEIPRGLFKAVAQVLAWVMGMKAYKEGKGNRPRDLNKNLPIPPELRF